MQTNFAASLSTVHRCTTASPPPEKHVTCGSLWSVSTIRTLLTEPWWPVNVAMHAPLLTSHTRAVRSADALATYGGAWLCVCVCLCVCLCGCICASECLQFAYHTQSPSFFPFLASLPRSPFVLTHHFDAVHNTVAYRPHAVRVSTEHVCALALCITNRQGGTSNQCKKQENRA